MADGAIVREDAAPLDLFDRAMLMTAGARMIGEAMLLLREEAIEEGAVSDEEEALEMFVDRENMAYFALVHGMALDQHDAQDLMRMFVMLTQQLLDEQGFDPGVEGWFEEDW
jgi:hypothetical protein